MKNFKPTHFIEQYNAKEEYRSDTGPNEHFTEVMPLDYLPRREEFMKTITTLKTVAIFKIQFKDSSKI